MAAPPMTGARGATTSTTLLGERLVAAGIATRSDVDLALERQRESRGSLGYQLLRLGRVDAGRLSAFLDGEIAQGRAGMAVSDPACLDVLPARLAHLYNAYPLASGPGRLLVALPPHHGRAVSAISEALGAIIEPTILPADWLRKAVERDYLGARRPAVEEPPAGLMSFLVDDGMEVRPVAPDLRTPQLSPEVFLRSLLGEAVARRRRTLEVAASGAAAPPWMTSRAAEALVRLVERLARLPEGSEAARGRFQIRLRGRNAGVQVVREQGRVAHLRLHMHDHRLASEEVDDLFAGHEDVQDAIERFAQGSRGLVLWSAPRGSGASRALSALFVRLADAVPGSARLSEACAAGPWRSVSASCDDVEVARGLHDEMDASGALLVDELPGPRSVERALLLAARRPVLAGLVAADGAAALAWLRRQGFGSALKTGLLTGVVSALGVEAACGACTVARPIDLGLAQKWALGETSAPASAGCATCLPAPVRTVRPVFAWTPVAGEPEDSFLVEDETVARAAWRARGSDLLLDRALDACRTGSGDAASVESFLAGAA